MKYTEEYKANAMQNGKFSSNCLRPKTGPLKRRWCRHAVDKETTRFPPTRRLLLLVGGKAPKATSVYVYAQVWQVVKQMACISTRHGGL